MTWKDLNIPNTLTILRVISVPFFIYFLLSQSLKLRIVAFVLFSLASLTDLVDGYIARRLKQETEFGKFLDPLADKFLVLGAFITFLFMTEQIQVWMVLCIVGRDMLITALRYLAIWKGKSMRTSRFGKIKTAFQMFSIIVILLSFVLITYRERRTINEMYRQGAEQGIGPFQMAVDSLVRFLEGPNESIIFGLSSFLPYFLMLFTTIITVISGLRYLYSNYELLLPPYRASDRKPES
jgi:cardiolipin synthase